MFIDSNTHTHTHTAGLTTRNFPYVISFSHISHAHLRAARACVRACNRNFIESRRVT